jgi:hypothetical protein
MKDSSEQVDTQNSQGQQPSELNERLCRRLTEPCGVIDTSYARQKYVRLIEWLDHRLSLVNEIQMRYTFAEDVEDAGERLVMQEPLAEQVNIYSTTQAATPSADVPPATESFSPDSISRQVSFANSAQPLAEELSSEQTGSSFIPEGKFRVSRRHVPIDLSLARPGHQSVPLPSNVAPAPPDATAIEPVDEFGEIRRVQESEPISTGEAAGASHPPTIAAKTISAAPVGHVASTLPLAKPQVVPRLSQRRAPTAERPDQSPAFPEIETGDTGTGQRNPVVADEPRDETKRKYPVNQLRSAAAVEIRQDLSTQVRPVIIWRHAEDPLASHIPNGPDGNRQPGSASQDQPAHTAHHSRQSDGPPAPVNAPSHAAEIGIEQFGPQVLREISEKVMRDISRDLAIELERKGLRKWR